LDPVCFVAACFVAACFEAVVPLLEVFIRAPKMCWCSSNFENQNVYELQAVQQNLLGPAQLVSAQK
jgi:hypothetical protein